MKEDRGPAIPDVRAVAAATLAAKNAAAAAAAARAAEEAYAKRPKPQLNNILKDARLILGLSFREAGRKAGISPAYVSQIESGKIPEAGILLKLAKAYDLPHEQLLIVAGHLNAEAGINPDTSSILLSAAKSLTDSEKREVINYIHYLVSKRERKRGEDGHEEKAPPSPGKRQRA